MIKGIGVDIISTTRFETLKNKEAFLEQVFTDGEIENAKGFSNRNMYWARLFAIKEALFKTFKIGLHYGSYWQDIEISKDFVVRLSGYFQAFFNKKTKVFVAHSCSQKLAVSIAFIQD